MFCPLSGKEIPGIIRLNKCEIASYIADSDIGNNPAYWLIILVFIIFAVLLITALIIRLIDFSHQLKYINIEIRRTKGTERQYWISRKRQLWLSLFLVNK